MAHTSSWVTCLRSNSTAAVRVGLQVLPLNCLRAFLLLAVCHAATWGGELVKHTIESERLAGNLIGEDVNQEIQVYLPGGYHQSEQEYPVVYWFAGGGQAQTAGIDESRIDLEFASGRSREAIVVFMPGKTNFGTTIYQSSTGFGDWEGFLIDEVIPFVDESYRTQASGSKRGAMGFSLGGLAALTLPLDAPGTFGAVGANDPSIPFISGLVRSEEQLPDGVEVDEDAITLEEFFDMFPEEFSGYKTTGVVMGTYGQLSNALSPNPEHPLLGEIPFDVTGEWLPEVREQWRQWDLLDPEIVDLRSEELAHLTSISVVFPGSEELVNTPWNREMVRVMEAAGLPVQGIESPGEHSDLQHERFASLLSNVTFALSDERMATLVGDYQQSFDDLGPDVAGTELLPDGWMVSDHYGHVHRDRTNVDFDAGDPPSGNGDGPPLGNGDGPHIFNVGEAESTDRGLGVYVETGEGARIRFRADVAEPEMNALRVSYNLDAWRLIESDSTDWATIDLYFAEGLGDGYADERRVGSDDLTAGEGSKLSTDHTVFVSSLGDIEALQFEWVIDAGDLLELGVELDDVQIEFLFLGDHDGDGVLSVADLDLLSAAVRGNSMDSGYDLDGDGMVGQSDRDRWVESLYRTVPGDTNLDRIVDFNDFLALSNGFNDASTGWGQGDFDGDGDTTFGDFLALSRNFGLVLGAGVQSVPEPSSTWGIFITACLCGRRRRKRRT